MRNYMVFFGFVYLGHADPSGRASPPPLAICGGEDRGDLIGVYLDHTNTGVSRLTNNFARNHNKTSKGSDGDLPRYLKKRIVMGILFYGKDILHKIAVKFAPSFLPDTKKPFYLKTARQKVLDVHGIAARAARYDMSLPPEVIENVLNASFELIAYLIADGFKIKTPLFTIRVRVPGEYDGTETRLPAGVYPEARIQVSADLREYLKKRAEIVLDGFDESGELIAEAIDEASGLSGRIMTMGNILTIYGSGLKVDADSAKKAEAGVFFENEAGERIKTPAIAVNEPRTLKVLIPLTLESGAPYRIVIHTQTPARGHGSLLKNIRQVRSEFTLKAERG